METIRPAIVNPEYEDRSRRPLVKDLTFLFGPPTDPDSAREIARAAESVGVTPEELWIEMVRGSVRELLEAKEDGRSILDEVVSEAVGEMVTVWDVIGALHVQCGRQFPGLTISAAKVLNSSGDPVECDLSDNDVRLAIGTALMQYTHADWATCTACYAADELGFPSFADHRKEA